MKNIYDLQNNKKEGEAYLRELNRMQKLDHIRVQVSQHQRSTALNNPWFNKTVDFNPNGSMMYSLENESLTQDSLFVNKEDQNKIDEVLDKIPWCNDNIDVEKSFVDSWQWQKKNMV